MESEFGTNTKTFKIDCQVLTASGKTVCLVLGKYEVTLSIDEAMKISELLQNAVEEHYPTYMEFAAMKMARPSPSYAIFQVDAEDRE